MRRNCINYSRPTTISCIWLHKKIAGSPESYASTAEKLNTANKWRIKFMPFGGVCVWVAAAVGGVVAAAAADDMC